MAHVEKETKATATLTIDGRQVTVPTGTTILEAAAQLGITIPTLCWLKKVSTTGACRVCVVEIEGVAIPQTACNTPVKDGIVVTTTSEKLEAIRKRTMELMLVNHPLDCPVCDAAGECDLQDTCYALHVNTNRYGANLEPLPIVYDWPLIENCATRCILCEKCVKVCHEIVGADAISIMSRGDRSIIDTPDGKPLDCDFCGNCVGACPTGTLISKPFKFRGRPWTFTVSKGICGFCSSGCEVEYHSREGRIERVTSSDENYNHGNLCINGRFGYAAFNSAGRLTTPLVKDSAGNQQKSDWNTALGTVAAKLKQFAGPTVAGIGSPRVTNEENYLFQKLLRGALGSNNIDSEARLGYLPAQFIQYEQLGYSGGTYDMNTIEQAGCVFVIGADLKGESAGYAYRVIHASYKSNGRVILASTRQTGLRKFANSFLQYKPGTEAWLVAGLNKAVLAEGRQDNDFLTVAGGGLDQLKQSLDALSFETIAEITGVSEAALREAARNIGGGKTAVIYGADVMRAADRDNAVKGVVNLAILTGAVGTGGAGLYPLDEKNNTQGMVDMGICPEYLPGFRTYDHAAAQFGAAWGAGIPAAPGRDLFGIIDGIEKGEIKALYVMGSDPLHFMPDRNRVLKALQKLELLVVQDLFLTDTARLAHVVLPAATAAEKSGSFTSVDNRVQSFEKAVAPAGQTRTDACILGSLYEAVTGSKIPVSADSLDHEIASLSGLYNETCRQGACSMGRTKTRGTFGNRKANLAPLKPAAPAAAPAGFPFSLTVGPVLRHNGTYSTQSDNNLSVAGEAYVAIHAADAEQAGIVTGTIVKVSSAQGASIAKAVVSDALQPGMLFAPSHFRDPQFNGLTGQACGPVAVKLDKA